MGEPGVGFCAVAGVEDAPKGSRDFCFHFNLWNVGTGVLLKVTAHPVSGEAWPAEPERSDG